MSASAILLMLSTLWRPALAVPSPAPPPQPSPPQPRADVLERLRPVAAEWQRAGGARSAAVLFDGDAGSSLRTDGEATIRVSLAGRQPVRGLGVFGGAAGRLSVAAVDGGGRPVPVAGLQDLDLGKLPAAWKRFWADAGPLATELVLSWQPAAGAGPGGTALRELELWGLAPDRAGLRHFALADRLQAGSLPGAVEAWAEPAAAAVSSLGMDADHPSSFGLRLPIDPSLAERAFLVYELGGLGHWSAPPRQVNGFSVQGGFRPEAGGEGSRVQVEEISPEWLFKGDNEIRFFPTSDDDMVGYEIASVRLVVVPGLAGAAAEAPAVIGDAARLGDGDVRTGLRAAQGQTAVTLPLAAGAQPSALSVLVTERLSGKLTATTVRADGRAAGGVTWDAAKMTPGWHTLGLDGLRGGAGVRLAWDPGAEGSGLVSEVRLASSPAPAGPARDVVIAYPLHGECVDHQVYVRGFVRGAAGDPARPELRAGGSPVAGALAADGAFSLLAAEPASVVGRPWSFALETRFADGARLTRQIEVNPCGDRPLLTRAPRPSGPLPLVADEGAPFSRMVPAGKAQELSYDGMKLEIPAGALDKDTLITVRPLGDSQVATMNPLLENLTPDGGGFRLGPHNLQFKKPVKITLPFDRGRADKEVDHGAPGIYFYDEEGGEWHGLGPVTSPKKGVLVAQTTHFTDFISATIASPQSPSPASNTPSMLADLNLGNAAAGIRLMQPPNPSNDGGAHISYPLEIAPGRNGMQPKVEIRYDSDSLNGNMGQGWSFPISHIEVDTRFGTPPYDFVTETERFLLDGEELIPVDLKNGDTLQRKRNREYRRRVERGFEKIVRLGHGVDDNTPWLVTDRDGTVYEYGTRVPAEHAALFAPNRPDLGPTVYSALSKVTDTSGNTVDYTYDFDEGTDNDEYQQLTPRNITYTANGALAPAFRIGFEMSSRTDPYSDARTGQEIRHYDYIGQIRSEYFSNGGWHIFRRYVFNYKIGEFGRSLLDNVSVYSGDGDPGTFFYKHTFKYKTLPRDTGGRVLFGSPVRWGDVNLAGTLGKSADGGSGGGLHGFGGLGPTSCYPHVGFGMSGGISKEKGTEEFTDVNGDGLPDLITTGGQVFLNGFRGTNRDLGAFTQAAMTPVPTLSQTDGSSRTYGIGIHFMSEYGGSGSKTIAHTTQGQGLVDVNGDGLPDLFNGSSVACNTFPASRCCADLLGTATCPGQSSTPGFSSAIPWPGGDTSGFPVFQDPSPSSSDGSSFESQVFTRWTAPFAGSIKIAGPAVRATFIPPAPAPNPGPMDEVTASLYARTYAPTEPGAVNGVRERLLWSHRFTASDPVPCSPQTPSLTAAAFGCFPDGNFTWNVKQGDQFFFVVNAPPGKNQSNALRWDPIITYTDVGCPSASHPLTCPVSWLDGAGSPIFRYDMAADFRMAGATGDVWTSSSADTKPDGSRAVSTKVLVTGAIHKAAVADDVRFQIVRLHRNDDGTLKRDVVWPTTGEPFLSPAGQSIDITFGAGTQIEVQGQWRYRGDDNGFAQWTLDGDQLIFQVVSDTPVDTDAIVWDANVSYLNYCRPEPKEQQNYIRLNGVPNPYGTIDCSTPPADALGAAASRRVRPQYPAFRYEPDRADISGNPLAAVPTRPAPFYPFNDTASHNIGIQSIVNIKPFGRGIDPDVADGGQVVAIIQTPTRLIDKRVFKLAAGATADRNEFFDLNGFNVGGDEAIYFTLYSYGRHTVSWTPQVQSVSTGQTWWVPATVHRLTEPPLPGVAALPPHGGKPQNDPMAGGFHQWAYGVFNGITNTGADQPFDSKLIRNGYTAPGNNYPSFFPAVAAPDGINSSDGSLLGANGKVWRGRGADDYIGPGLFHPSYSGSGVMRGTLMFGSPFRRSSSTTTAVTVTLPLSEESGSGTNYSELDIADLNGDRVPDLLGVDRFALGGLFSNRTPGYQPVLINGGNGMPFPFGQIRMTKYANVRWGLGLGSVASEMFVKPTTSGRTKALLSSLPSFGLAYGSSTTTQDLLDINGDGLADQVRKAPDGNSLEVHLSLGPPRRFFQKQTQSFRMERLDMAAGIILDQARKLALDLRPPIDGLHVQDSNSNSLQVAVLGIGGGPAMSTARDVVTMIDMNGDGLPDRVRKQPGSDMMVQYNTGRAFADLADVQYWTSPAWSSTLNIEGSTLPNLFLGSNDVLSFSQSRNVALSAGTPPIPFPFLFGCVVLELSAQMVLANDTNTQMSLQDINGDGLPDQVFKENDLGGSSSTGVWVKLNPAGGANLLTHVDGPLGGSFDIEYARAGNEVNLTASPKIDMPYNRWVMSAVTVNRQPVGQTPQWNADPAERRTFAYAAGFHSRQDRDFLGFAKVTTTFPLDGSSVEETYDTSDVYHKGLLTKRVVRDGTTAKNVFEATDVTYETRVLQGLVWPQERREARFVLEKTRTSRSYEGGSTNPDAATVTRQETRDCENTLGALTKYSDLGDTNTTADDVNYTIDYDSALFAARIVRPSAVTAKDTAGTVISKRSATYYGTGRIASMTDMLVGGRKPTDGTPYTGVFNPIWGFTYDSYGNLKTVSSPSGYTITVLAVDATTNSYPTSMADSFGYTWSQFPHLPTGELDSSTDINGVSSYRFYDAHHRLLTIRTPDQNSTSIRLQVGYNPVSVGQTAPASAQVNHLTPELNKTLTLVDGWGRAIQTKTKAEIDDGAGNAVAGLIISGRVGFDARGRMAAQGQPYFKANQTVEVATAFDPTASTRPTTFGYDVLGRRTRVTYPSGSGIPDSKVAFDVVSLSSIQRLRQIATDSNGQFITTYRDGRQRVIQTDQRNVVGTATTPTVLSTKYAYDPLDRLKTVTDPKTKVTTAEWDTIGHMVALTTPDTGKTFYDFDIAGQLARRQNANGQLVQYNYTFNRLDSIVYPGGGTGRVDFTYGAPGALNGTAGRVRLRSDEAGMETFGYDFMGNVVVHSWLSSPPPGMAASPPFVQTHTTRYSYEPAQGTLRTVAVDAGETLTYVYDSAGKVKQIKGVLGTTTNNYVSSILYDEFGQRRRMVLGDGLTTLYGYDQFTRRLAVIKSSMTGLNLQNMAYAYDSVGNVISVSNTIPAPTTNPPAGTLGPGPTVTTQSFTYDNLYQLKKAGMKYTGPGSLGGRTYSLSMTYDELGNITRKTQTDINVPTVGGASQTKLNVDNVYAYSATKPHAATTIGSGSTALTADYDADGNQKFLRPTSGSGRDMTWTEDDRLRTATVAGTTSRYTYRSSGERAIKRAEQSSAETLYANPFFETKSNVQSVRHVMLGAERIASVVTSPSNVSNTFYYHSDHLQGANYVTTKSGNSTVIAQHNEYLPFGENWVDEVRSGLTATPYKWNGKEMDETGLYYFGGRYYDPATSRWQSADPAMASYISGGGAYDPKNLSTYSYAFNNPFTVRDPDGRQALLPGMPGAGPPNWVEKASGEAPPPAPRPAPPPLSPGRPGHPDWRPYDAELDGPSIGPTIGDHLQALQSLLNNPLANASVFGQASAGKTVDPFEVQESARRTQSLWELAVGVAGVADARSALSNMTQPPGQTSGGQFKLDMTYGYKEGASAAKNGLELVLGKFPGNVIYVRNNPGTCTLDKPWGWTSGYNSAYIRGYMDAGGTNFRLTSQDFSGTYGLEVRQILGSQW